VKICHLIASKGLGRGEAYIDLVNALCSEVEIVLLVPRGALYLHRVDKRIQIIEYQSRNKRANPFLLYEIYSLIKHIKPDIVHTHFAKATEIFYLLNKRLKLPWVATKHNPRKGRIFNKADRVIAVSEGVAGSIGHDRIRVIHNGIKPIPVAGRKGERDFFSICAVGRLDKIKGFDLLISEVAKLDFNFRLQIVGEGEEHMSLQRQIDGLGLSERVDLLGFRTDVPDLIADSDLQVMTSLSEGFSLAMIEAIYYAPVFISTNVSGCNDILPPELLIDGTEVAECIAAVHADYSEYCKRFAKVKEVYGHSLHIDETARQHFAYYQVMSLVDGQEKT